MTDGREEYREFCVRLSLDLIEWLRSVPSSLDAPVVAVFESPEFLDAVIEKRFELLATAGKGTH